MHELHEVLGSQTSASMLVSFAAIAVLTLTSCSDDATAPVINPPAAVAVVEVMPASVALNPGGGVQLHATLMAADSTVLTGRIVTWSSNDPRIATVTSTGLVNALGSGVAKVRAQAEGRWAEATISIADPESPRPMLSSLSPTSVPAGSPGVTIVLTGAGFASGAQILWNGQARPAQWISGSELRLTLAASQLQNEGTVQIAVRNPGGDSDPLPFLIGPVAVDRVTVSPTTASISVGGQVHLTATAYAADGSELFGRSFTWTSTATATASVSASGLVTGHRAGDVLITVESEGRTASATVSVLTPVAFVTVSPNPAAVLVNTSLQLAAITSSATGGVLTGRTITWSSDNSDIATVDAQGVVRGVAKGTTRISAESEGKTGWSTVEVRQYADGPVQSYVLRGTVNGWLPAVGTTTWVDAQGLSHEATLYLAGGELTMDQRDSRYEQTLLLDMIVTGQGTVGQTVWTDEGTYVYLAPGDRLQFVSSAGGTFTALPAPAGEIIIEQGIGAAPLLMYRWVLQ